MIHLEINNSINYLGAVCDPLFNSIKLFSIKLTNGTIIK